MTAHFILKLPKPKKKYIVAQFATLKNGVETMKQKNFTGIMASIKDATAFIQGKRSRALVVRPPKPNKADNPAPSHSS